VISAPTRLEPSHPIEGFACGYDSLDRWLASQALRADRERTAVTYIVNDEVRVVGYYSLASHSVRRASVGGGWLQRNTPDPIPALLLGRLAVDLRYQGQGIGWSLLQHAIGQALVTGSLVDIRALVVDPIDQSATDFYAHYGFRLFPADSQRMFLPLR
jgi:GNAT superfamily N-acetyltransferase